MNFKNKERKGNYQPQTEAVGISLVFYWGEGRDSFKRSN